MDGQIEHRAQYISGEFDRLYGLGWCVFISLNSESETWVTFNHGEYIKLEFEHNKIIIFNKNSDLFSNSFIKQSICLSKKFSSSSVRIFFEFNFLL